MAILKKQSKCASCGRPMTAGAVFKWKKVEVQGFYGQFRDHLKTKSYWAPAHTDSLQCKFAGVEGAESAEHGLALLIEQTKDKVSKLAKQEALFLDDPEMIEFTKGQTGLARAELEQYISIHTATKGF